MKYLFERLQVKIAATILNAYSWVDILYPEVHFYYTFRYLSTAMALSYSRKRFGSENEAFLRVIMLSFYAQVNST